MAERRRGSAITNPVIVENNESPVPSGSIEVTVILPAYNEAAALPQVLSSLHDVLDVSTEVIVVDDGSTDDTAAAARANPCRLIRHRQNYGKGSAVRTGLLAARGQFIIVMDADNTYPVTAIPSMINLSKRYDFVRCVRRYGRANSPVVNRVGNVLFDAMLKLMYGLEGADHLSGLYGLRREALDAIQFKSNRFDLEIEIGIKVRARRLRTVTLPIEYSSRVGDKKLQPWRDGWTILRRILSLGLVYNPGLMFVAPGVLLWLFSAILVGTLSQGSIITPYAVRLDVNSFIVATIGASVGFQLIVFGIVAALYGTEIGSRPSLWLRTLSHTKVRFGAAIIGTLFTIVGVIRLLAFIIAWLASRHQNFQQTRALVLSGVLLSFGVQVILAAMFVSIFAGRLEGDRTASIMVETWAESLKTQRNDVEDAYPASRSAGPAAR